MRISSIQSRRHHRTALAIVTALAFLTRFVGLSHPSEVVFDEYHINRFISYYLKRTYFFDLHPPFGRLVYALIAWLGGYNADYFCTRVGESYIENGVPYLALRTLPAALSSLTVSVVYLIMWETGHAIPACLLASGLVLFDNAHIGHTRIIYLDAILVFATACSLLTYIKFSKLKSQAFSTKWCKWLFLTGLALSISISTKYVGLFAYIVIGTAIVLDLWGLFEITSPRAVSLVDLTKHIIARGFALVVVPFMIYLSWFQINFAILTQTGPGIGYMSPEFADTLWSEDTPPGGPEKWSFFRKWIELQGTMFEYNSVPAPQHYYSSRPQDWPLLSRGVIFWENNETRQQIYFIGNIVGWWTAAALLVVFVLLVALDRLTLSRGVHLLCDRTRSRLLWTTGFFFFGWAVHYFPFFLMNRQLMLHSYLPAHLMSTLVAGSLLEVFFDARPAETANGQPVLHEKKTAIQDEFQLEDTLHGSQQLDNFAGSNKTAWIVCAGILGPVFVFWCFWFPLTYGFPGLSAAAVRSRQINGYRLFYSTDP